MILGLTLARAVFWTPMLTALIIIVAITPAVLIFLYHYLKIKYWEHKYLPTSKDKNSEAFLNAYIASVVLMMKLDIQDGDLKKRVLQNKILELKKDLVKLWETFDALWQNDISAKRIARWCVKHLDEVERSDLVYMLVELAILDGRFLAKEYEFLKNLMLDIKLPLEDLKGMIASHRQRMRREEGQRQQRQQQSRTHQKTSQQARKPSKSAVETALEILGLKKGADQAAIKKAYRSLAKKHHPDRFATQDEAIVKAAEARFIEIQEAYETASA